MGVDGGQPQGMGEEGMRKMGDEDEDDEDQDEVTSSKGSHQAQDSDTEVASYHEGKRSYFHIYF